MNEEIQSKQRAEIISNWLRTMLGGIFNPLLVAAIAIPLIYTFVGVWSALQHQSATPAIGEITRLKEETGRLEDLLLLSPELKSVSTEVTVDKPTIFSRSTVRITAVRPAIQSDPFKASLSFLNSSKFEAADFAVLFGGWLVTIYLLSWFVRTIKATSKIGTLATKLAQASTRAPGIYSPPCVDRRRSGGRRVVECEVSSSACQPLSWRQHCADAG